MRLGRASIVLCVGLAACVRAAPESPDPECAATFEAGRFEAAARVCASAFDGRGDVPSGELAIAASQRLGQADVVVTLGARLPPGAAGAETWRTVAQARLSQRDPLLAAAEGFRRALERDLASGDSRGAAKDAYEVASLSWRAADFFGALDFARQSYAHARRAADVDAQVTVAGLLAAVLYDVGDLDASYRVLRAGERILPPGQPERLARLRANEGSILLDGHRPELARAVLEESLGVLGSRSNARAQALVHLNLVNACLTLNDLAAAERHLAAAWELTTSGRPSALYYRTAQVRRAQGRIPEAEAALREGFVDGPSPEWASYMFLELGRVSEAKADERAADAAYANAIEIVEGMRRALKVSDIKETLTTTRREAYEAAFRLRARHGDVAGALYISERVKARAFLDARIGEAALPSAQEADVTDIEQVSGEAAQALASVLPALDVTPAADPPPIDQVLASLGEQHVLAYFVAAGELWGISLGRDRTRMKLLAPSAAGLAELVDRLGSAPDDRVAATELGQIVLDPELLPPPGARLSLVPDQLLTRVPFAALRQHDRYLIDDYVVSYAPSVTALAAIERDGDTEFGPPVVIGDSWGDLVGAADEAGAVAAALGVAPALAGAATIDELRLAEHAQVLHLAVHTGVGPFGPWLALADGSIDAASVLRWRLRPRLAVLAGCASGAHHDGEIWGSMGAAFLASGSQAVLATSSAVPDEPTRELVARYFAEEGAIDPPAALARAQRSLAALGRPPSVWAPFVILGRPTPLGTR